jgi:N-6 DNA Methylase
MDMDLQSAVAAFGAETTAKLSNPAAHGAPEDQLRGPLEALVGKLATLVGFSHEKVTAVGESALSDLKTRPDYAITRNNVLVGYLEVKAPGKGADPRKFRGAHDKDQWVKLSSLPNLIYTDGNEFSLWHYGEAGGSIVHLVGDVSTTGADLSAPSSLLDLFEKFFDWEPVPPRSAKQLAELSARLCRIVRDEVLEHLAHGNPALTELATDWRKLLFPEAGDDQFADGYAQAVTFGLLMARAKGITLSEGLPEVARQVGETSSLIGAALDILTRDLEDHATLKTSVATLTRVLDVVEWSKISKGKVDAWLYFYEDFLDVYDRKLRKKTGSYYTPPEVVASMTRLVHEALQQRFGLPQGLASSRVTIADPAVGTGTFLLGVLRCIEKALRDDEGEHVRFALLACA